MSISINRSMALESMDEPFIINSLVNRGVTKEFLNKSMEEMPKIEFCITNRIEEYELKILLNHYKLKRWNYSYRRKYNDISKTIESARKIFVQGSFGVIEPSIDSSAKFKRKNSVPDSNGSKRKKILSLNDILNPE